MKRTSVDTKATDLFGSGKHGFTDGIASVTAPTILDSSVMNSVVEEIARAVEDSGAILNASDYGQLSQILIGRSELAELMNPARSYDSGGANAMRAAAIRDTGLVAFVGDAGKIFSTPDFGAVMTSRTAASSYAGNFQDIIWSGVKFAACGDSGEIQISPDGVAWTHIVTGVSDALSALATDGSGVVVAFGGTGGQNIFSSNHGVTWTAHTAINGGSWFAARAAYDSGAWIVVGNPGSSDLTKNVYRSLDGGLTGWNAINLTAVLPSGYTIIDVAARHGRGFVAQATKSASSDKILTSPDGITWTVVATIGGATKRLVAGRALVALVALPAIYTSYDGASWGEHRSLGWTAVPNRFQFLRVYDTSLFVAHAVTTDAGKGNLSRRIAG